MFNLIVAHSFPYYGIGKDNKLPWQIKKDLKYFKDITSTVQSDTKINYINACIMGRKTWESIPENHRPLLNRINIIITQNPQKSENPFIIYTDFVNLQSTLNKFNETNYTSENGKTFQIFESFIIGGESIYKYAFENLPIKLIYTTEIYVDNKDFTSFFPIKIHENKKFTLLNCSPFQKENEYLFRYLIYLNKELVDSSTKLFKNKEEDKYLEIMNNILTTGIKRADRTGTGTLSLFGQQMKFDLSDTFPICTTKKIFFRAVFEELMLYIRGQTDNKILNSKKIHIWDGNTSEEFLKKRGLSYREGDMGETYGFNFRHFGGEYKGCDADYSGVGFDQLQEVIRLIKEDPTSRRIIINLWNPDGNQRAALPSCLCMYQFYVDTTNNKLNLQIYIRSSDYFLANNWNTCTGALLVHMLCNLEGINYTPGELTVISGDTHLYLSHIEQVKTNLNRQPYPFPKLLVSEKKNNIESFEFTDLKLVGYKNYPNIPAEMAV